MERIGVRSAMGVSKSKMINTLITSLVIGVLGSQFITEGGIDHALSEVGM